VDDTTIDGQRAWALGDYVAILARRKWIILEFLVILPAVAVVIAYSQSPTYRASADILINRTSLGSALLGVADPSSFQDPTREAATDASLAKVPAVADRAAQIAKIRGIDGTYVLSNGIVRTGINDDLMRFSITSGDPAVAVKLSTAYAQAFIEYQSNLDTSALRAGLNDVNARLKALKGSGQTKSALYLSLADKQQQLRTLELLQTPSKLVRPATDAGQISPTPVRNGILGLMGGLVLGISVAFLLELLDRRIRSEDEIERKLRLPLLARIPPPPRSARGENRLVMVNAPKSIYAEPFRRLRTNLEFVNADTHAQTILVTSSVAGEGKSTTVANLAVAAARAGRRVAVVDLDLRRPTLHESFGVSPHPGATNVALGSVHLNDALKRIRLGDGGMRPAAAHTNGYSGETILEFLPAGTLPPNPGEFLGTSGIAQLLADLRERADLVFVDAAPLLAVGDTLPLSARVDAIVIVTQFGVISRPMLNDLTRELQTLPTPKLGFVLTGADATGIYGYGYDYAHPADDAAEDARSAGFRRQAATSDPTR